VAVAGQPRLARPARPAARARPLDGVVPAGRRVARPPLVRLPGIHVKVTGAGRTWVPGSGQLCRRRQPLSGTLTRCQDWRDLHLLFHFYDQFEPSTDFGDLLRDIDRDLPGIARPG
jgi:hypothetical protein